uniref:protein-serine/threonine phosphatase n=1 Tax=Chenopodium quinoa TaxID=63459 RepID=A0A803M730_CHEQI
MPCIPAKPRIIVTCNTQFLSLNSSYSDLPIEMGKDLEPCNLVSESESLIPVVENPKFVCSLKRKRPPKIQIPNVLQEILVDTQIKFGCSPVKNDEIYCFEDLGVGVCSIKGKKKFMEDTHKIVSSIGGNAKKGFFGVYDGHGGRKAAEFVAESLHKNVIELLHNCDGNMAKEEAVKAAYLKTDREFLEQEVSSGSCCVTALIEGSEMVVSNLGDCRAVLCRGGVAEALTKDHRAGMEEERKRIEDKPHSTILDLTPDMDFLVLASDGLWEEVGNQEAIDIVQQSCIFDKKPELPIDGSNNKIQRSLKVNDDDYACVSTSSSPKVKRVSLNRQKKKTTLSPSLSFRKTDNSIMAKEDVSYFDNNNLSPVKLGITSVFSNKNMKTPSPSPSYNSYKKIEKDGLSDFDSENHSPPTKLRRTSLFSHKNMKNLSLSPSCQKTENTSTVKEGLSEFYNKNESPAKLRRTPLFSPKSIKTQSPNRENKRPTSDGLVAACKKLVNLAVSRGSMDDITVMVVDLKHYKLDRNALLSTL